MSDKSFLQTLKGYFITGLVLFIPFYFTIILLKELFFFTDNIIGKYIKDALGFTIPGVGIISIIILLSSLGYVVRYYFGRNIIEKLENFLVKIPMVDKIYITIRQISLAFFDTKNSVFKKVVLIEYPRKGIYSLGFITSEDNGKLDSEILNTKTVNLFIPTSPNPTSGLMIIARREDVIFLNISVAEGMTLVVSGGAVVPEEFIESPISLIAELNKKAKELQKLKLIEKQKKEKDKHLPN